LIAFSKGDQTKGRHIDGIGTQNAIKSIAQPKHDAMFNKLAATG